jgi:hypothetical protein
VANPKDPRQHSRERRSGDDLNFAAQTRERSQRKPQQYQVAPEAPVKQAPKQAGRAYPAMPLVPPDELSDDPSPHAKAAPKYPGVVMNESHRRKESGRLGQPLPIPQPPKPAASKSAATSAIRSSGAAPMPAVSRGAAAPARPSAPPARSVPQPLARELEQADRRAYTERASRSVARSSIAEQMEEIYEVYYVPTFGPHQALIACVIASVALAWALFSTPLGAPLGLVPQSLTWSEWATQTIQSVTASAPAKQLDTSRYMQPLSAPIGETSIMGDPTITAAEIDEILASYGSPAAGSGQVFYDIGVEYGIDPAYAVAFFIHESSAGTNQGWAGIKADGSTTHNIGNIICAGYPTCYNRFRDYGSWSEGIADWYKLIAVEYIQGRGASTIEQIIPIYAPSFENDVPGYVNAVNTLVSNWRQGLR